MHRSLLEASEEAGASLMKHGEYRYVTSRGDPRKTTTQNLLRAYLLLPSTRRARTRLPTSKKKGVANRRMS
jgi:hypothetical protein